MCVSLAPRTSSAKPTFSATVRFSRSLKSWNTTPMLRRKYGTPPWLSRLTFRPPTRIWPLVGASAQKRSRKSVVFPAPEGPVSQTNSPFSTWRLTSASTGGSSPYDLVTWKSWIISRAVDAAADLDGAGEATLLRADERSRQRPRARQGAARGGVKVRGSRQDAAAVEPVGQEDLHVVAAVRLDGRSGRSSDAGQDTAIVHGDATERKHLRVARVPGVGRRPRVAAGVGPSTVGKLLRIVADGVAHARIGNLRAGVRTGEHRCQGENGESQRGAHRVLLLLRLEIGR